METMQTLKDIKDYLCQIPDEELDRLTIGHNFEGDGEICVLASEEDIHPTEGEGIFERVNIELFDSFIRKICSQQEKVYDEDDSLDDDTEPFSVTKKIEGGDSVDSSPK